MKLMRSSFRRTLKIRVKDETHKTIYSEVNEGDLYKLDKMSLDEKE